MKKCTTCKQLKPFAMFFALQTRVDGYDSKCKRCQKIYRKDLHIQRKADQKCRYCPKEYCISAGSKLYCIECWVDYIVKAMIRTTAKRYGLWITKDRIEKIVEGMYYKLLQTPKCLYTGETLLPGQNTHLDHKIPKVRNPKIALDIDNLQWVSNTYNRAKQDMTDEEFAAKFILKFR
jgi:5-methylcytosine-specific restriction endonuclease McrA